MARFGLRRSAPATMRVSAPSSITSEKNALTAAGMRIERRRDANTLRRLIQPWQTRSFAYYDLLGEIKYASQFYSRMLSPLRLYAGEFDEQGELQPTENETAIAALERIRDPGGGRTGLLSSYGRLMFLVGECYLLCTRGDDGLEQWEILSTDELRVQGDTLVRYRAPSLGAEEMREPSDDDWEPLTEGEAIPYRLWRRHPRYSMLADATMQGVLDLCEELVMLTQAVRARVRSRLAGGAGILFLDDALSQAPLDATAPDDDPAEDPFLADLTEAMTTPIVDEGAASAVVPLVIRVPVPVEKKLTEMVEHVQLLDPTQVYPETGLRYEIIKRIAIGLDMPAEILLGLQDANHWSAWQIDEQTWKGHGQPVAQQLCDDLSAAYYRPTLRAAGVEGWERFQIGYDEAAIVNHPDRSSDAKQLYDRRVIGKKALRDANGFSDDDAPTEAELAEQIGVAVHDGGLAMFGTPTVRGGVLETGPGELDSESAPGAPPDGTGASAEPGPPPEPDGQPAVPEGVVGSGNGNGNGHAGVDGQVARILGACHAAFLRSREAAGNRLVSLAKRDPELRALIRGVSVGRVAAELGPDRVRALGAPPAAELVAGARELILETLSLYGIEDAEVASRVADLVEQHAARTLYEERPSTLSPTFENYVAGLAGRAGR